MLKIKNYVKAASLEEAFELNQKKSACVLGGMVWLKMGNRNVSAAIDLSGLGLDTIEEHGSEFVIGCMTTLHSLETNERLNQYTHGALKESLRHIVGVQFRNCATVGGSLWGRYGFSDVLTVFLALDASVELYKGGRIPLREFVNMPKDRDILVSVVIPKKKIRTVYLSQRNTATDFPVLTCAAVLSDGEARTAIGARPGRAVLLKDTEGILKGFADMTETGQKDAACRFASYTAESLSCGSNMRASAEYRKLLAEVLTRRAWEAIGGMQYES